MSELYFQYLKNFLNYLKAEKFLSLNTCVSYEYDLKNFLCFLSAQNQLITNENVLYDYLHHINKHALATQKRHIASVVHFLNFCKNENYFVNNFKPLNLKSIKQYSTYIETEDFNKLLSALGPKDVRMQYIIETLYSTGMRISEFLNLKLSSVNEILKEKSLKIKGKGGLVRSVFFSENSIKSLQKFLEVRKSKSENIVPLKRQSVHLLLKKLALKTNVNVESVFPHSFRHRMLTDLVKIGTNIVVVQKIAGHKNLSTIEKYTHVEDYLYEEIAKFHPLKGKKDL